MNNVTCPNEIKIIDCLLDTVINAGWCVTVFDGESIILGRSTNQEEIKAELNSTGADWLRIFKQDEPYMIGSILVIYNNGGDGLDLIANTASGDHAAFDELLNPVYELVDQLATVEPESIDPGYFWEELNQCEKDK